MRSVGLYFLYVGGVSSYMFRNLRCCAHLRVPSNVEGSGWEERWVRCLAYTLRLPAPVSFLSTPNATPHRVSPQGSGRVSRLRKLSLNRHLHCFGYVGEGMGLDVGIFTGPDVVEVLAQNLGIGAGRCDVQHWNESLDRAAVY